MVCYLPAAFEATQLIRMEALRSRIDRPFALYQNYYLATRDKWPEKIRAAGGYGLERFDWYLAASNISEVALSEQNHPCSVIGHDLREPALHPDGKNDFKVLVDFPQPDHDGFRQRQIQALAKADIAHTVLEGRFSQAQMKQFYCEHSALMLSSRESFGLPIVENQLCGNLIFAAHNRWCPSHYINKSVHQAGEGELGRNFRVYNDDVDLLVEQLLAARENHSPDQVIQYFGEDYPHLYHGDLQALQACLAAVSKHDIHSKSHHDHIRLQILSG